MQVSLPHYRHKQFLKNAVNRYKKFLHLKRVESDAFLVPCYDFDLVWHAHQLHPVTYNADTSRILGRMFNHDDTVNDRTPGSKLSDSDAKTRQLWKDNYKVVLPILSRSWLVHAIPMITARKHKYNFTLPVDVTSALKSNQIRFIYDKSPLEP